MMTPVLAFEEMRLPLELFAASLVFLLPLAKRKPNFLSRATIGFLLGMSFSLLFFVIFKDKAHPVHNYLQGIWYPFIGFSAVFFAKFCFEINWCDALYIDIAAYCSQHIVYAFINEMIARVIFPEVRNHLFWYIAMSMLCCLLVYGSIYFFFAKQLRKCNGELFPDKVRTISFYVFLYLVLIAILSYFQNMFEHFSFEGHESLWFAGILTSLIFLTTQYSLFYARNLAQENMILEQYLNNNERFYHMSREQIEIINRKCHDLKHQLKVLATVDESERQTYIEEAQKSLMFYQQLVHSDNDVINTILAEKSLLCNEKNISFSCSIDHVDLGFIKLSDLYAILGNALDNAIEYVEQFETPAMRVINLRILSKQEFISIQITNPYQGPELSKGILPVTVKTDKTNHGFGLKSIKYLTEHYGGWLELATEDGMFLLQLMFPVPTSS